MQATNSAMIRCDEYLRRIKSGRIVLQLHDEMIFELPARGKLNLPIVKELQRLMSLSGDDIGIPLPVSASYHPRNWAEEEKLSV